MEEVRPNFNSKNTSTKLLNNINLFCCLYICVWTVLPIFRSITNTGGFKIIFFFIAGVWLLSSLLISRKWFMDLLGISIIGSIYLIIIFLYYVFDHGNMKLSMIVNPLFLFFFAFMGYYYSYYGDKKVLKIILSVITLCFLTTAITTIYNLLDNLNVARLMTSSSTSPQVISYLEKRNVAAFDFIYGLVILIPLLFVGLKFSLKKKSLLFITTMFSIVLLSLIVIALSNFTTAYLLLILAILLSLLPKKTNVYFMFFVFGLMVILLSPLLLEFIIFILTTIKETTPSIMTQYKLESIISFLYGETNYQSTTIRATLLRQSISSFFESPLLGVGAYYHDGSTNFIGNHSQFIDDFGRYGILGATPIIIFILIYLKKTKIKVKNINVQNAFVFSALLFIILGFLNPIQSYGILFSAFFVLPLLSRYID
ncbi:O-antigen ligase family protein [Bhargavaea massiliensis]|uniref:O-antigen ligase family protein n=1 Tax=Bhargavaea massiliensis TaxID=2697500 RepID=UPI001BCC5B7C|nr:O-antigen ligase family protein [Bhargavaea massiliensis]